MNCAWEPFLAVLPPHLRAQADEHRAHLQELRLRVGRPIVLQHGSGRSVSDVCATQEDLRHIFNLASRYSPWTVASVAQGYITIAGGHRIGLCGEAVSRDGKMRAIGRLTSMNIRICRDFSNICGSLGTRTESMLLLGPPGSGKTTLLRDLIRTRARRENIAVVDERGELFPEAAHFPTGQNTDVITGCTKAEGIETVLRVMGPQCIAVDEITAQADCDSLIRAGKCGVTLLATAHASCVEELWERPVYARLLRGRQFDTAVILRADKSWRTERIVRK